MIILHHYTSIKNGWNVKLNLKFSPNRPIRPSKLICRGQFSITSIWPKDDPNNSWQQTWLLNIFCLCFILFTLHRWPYSWSPHFDEALTYSESSIVTHSAVGCWTKLQVCTLCRVETLIPGKKQELLMKVGTSHFVSGSSLSQKTQLLINEVEWQTKVQMSLSHGRSLGTFEPPASNQNLAAVRAAGTTAKIACRTQLKSVRLLLTDVFRHKNFKSFNVHAGHQWIYLMLYFIFNNWNILCSLYDSCTPLSK